MRTGRVSQTALKVGLLMISLNEKPGWAERLPKGLARLTERLILAAGIPGFGPLMIRANKSSLAVWLSDLTERTVMPGIFEGIGERKIFMNEQVRLALAAGSSQVLVVGAGFDTLCLRLAPEYPQVRFFEVDHPTTSAAKARGVRRVGQPPNLILLQADLAQTSLSELLATTESWDGESGTTAVVEGLLLYLTVNSVHDLFREIREATGAGTRVAFSYGHNLSEHRLSNAYLEISGEPWLSSTTADELPQYLGPGWNILVSRELGTARDLEGFALAERA